MRTLSDLEAAFQALERRASAVYGEHDLDRTVANRRARTSTHRRVVLATAAAVAVGASAAVASYLWTENDNRVSPAGSRTAVCVAPLPPQWRQALPAHQIRVDGQAVLPVQVDADGRVTVDWVVDGVEQVGQVGRDDSVSKIAQLPIPTGHGVMSVSVDSRSVVIVLFRLPTGSSGGSPSDTDDAVVIDRHTGAVTHLLAGAPVPSGYAFGGHWGNLVDGIYYWAEVPVRGDGRLNDLLMSYDPTDHSYAVKARGDSLNSNPLGYFWDGGSFPLMDVPPVHPVVTDVAQTMATDGKSLSWSTYDDPSTVFWSDVSGASRAFSQNLMHQVSIDGVSGPYVFLSYGEGDDADKVSGSEHVLDTRTGALADTGVPQISLRGMSGNSVIAFWSTAKTSTTQVVNLNELPQIDCPSS